jgi:hypothetical protein
MLANGHLRRTNHLPARAPTLRGLRSAFGSPGIALVAIVVLRLTGVALPAPRALLSPMDGAWNSIIVLIGSEMPSAVAAANPPPLVEHRRFYPTGCGTYDSPTSNSCRRGDCRSPVRGSNRSYCSRITW